MKFNKKKIILLLCICSGIFLSCSNGNNINTVFPLNGEEINTLLPLFEWQESGENNSEMQYKIVISDNNNFSKYLTDSFTVNGVSFKPLKPLKNNTFYYWRIRHSNDNSGNNAWSKTFCFKTNLTFLLLPIDNESIDKVYNMQFKWEDVSKASVYHLQVSNSINFTGTMPVDIKLYGTEYKMVKNLEEGKYYWRVKTKDENNNWTDFGIHYSFTVGAAIRVNNIPIDILAPDGFSLDIDIYIDNKYIDKIHQVIDSNIHGASSWKDGCYYVSNIYSLDADSSMIGKTLILKCSFFTPEGITSAATYQKTIDESIITANGLSGTIILEKVNNTNDYNFELSLAQG